MERKISEIEQQKCLSTEHNPATMVVRTPGVYEHICPHCGEKQVFTIEKYLIR